MTQILRTEGLSKSWGGFAANTNIYLSFAPGERRALIGPNGAGKTTFINLLTGVLQPTSGDVFLGDERITGLAPHARVARGIVRTFQINTLFPGMTVLESVFMAVAERRRLGGVWYRAAATEHEMRDEAMALLERLGLHRDAGSTTRNLAYGRQRLLEIALAMACKPSILLLDEPAAGIPTGESAELFEVLERLPRDVTVVFIEHDMGLVFRFAERITVLVGGSVLVEGTPGEIAENPLVRQAYLGEVEHD